MDTSLAEHADKLLRAGVAGTSTSHGAEDNLYKIRAVTRGEESYTFGMEELLRGASFEEGYGAISDRLGYAPDHEENVGRGCIDPARTAAGLLEAGRRVREVAGGGGRVILGTGHPGALLMYYLGLGRWIEDLGGKLLTTQPSIRGDEPPLDWAGPVAVLGDGASLRHTHDPALMQRVLEDVAGDVDLVAADHGFAGAAVAAGIPTIAVMDTNDPAFAVAARRGANLTVVPMDDNRPRNSYAAALEVMQAAT